MIAGPALEHGDTNVDSIQTSKRCLHVWCMLRFLIWSKESNGNCSEITKKISKIGASGKFPANAERDLMTALDLPIVTGQQCSCKPLGLLSSCRMSLAFLLFAMPLPDGTCIIAELFRHQFVLWSTLTTGVCLPHCQTKLAAQLQTQAMYFLQIPIKDVSSDDKHARTTMRVPMVLPHELLNYLVVAWWAIYYIQTWYIYILKIY